MSIKPNVRFGSLADMAVSQSDVRFTSKADIEAMQTDVRFVPIADIGAAILPIVDDLSSGVTFFVGEKNHGTTPLPPPAL